LEAERGSAGEKLGVGGDKIKERGGNEEDKPDRI
jgi:hypothetical protein